MLGGMSIVKDDAELMSCVCLFGTGEVDAYDSLSLVNDPERILC